jgi:hypothetical protein
VNGLSLDFRRAGGLCDKTSSREPIFMSSASGDIEAGVDCGSKPTAVAAPKHLVAVFRLGDGINDLDLLIFGNQSPGLTVYCRMQINSQKPNMAREVPSGRRRN